MRLQLQGERDAAVGVEALHAPVPLHEQLQRVLVGEVVHEARETGILPLAGHLPPRLPVENRAVGGDRQRLTNRPVVGRHPLRANRGDGSAQSRVVGMRTQDLRVAHDWVSRADVPGPLFGLRVSLGLSEGVPGASHARGSRPGGRKTSARPGPHADG